MAKQVLRRELCSALLALLLGTVAQAADWPMLGRDGTRNGVSTETGAPTLWSVEDRSDGRLVRGPRGIRWSAPLGSQTHGSPVVSGGLVWIGTNGEQSQSVLKCFRVTDGKQVYEYVSPTLGDRSGWTGLGSSPLVEGDRLWLTTNRCEVLCLDIGPLLRGEAAPRELWKRDLIKEFDLFPHTPIMGPPRPCSIGPSHNGRIFVTTNNGVSQDRTQVPKPEAPSLVCLNKDTGEICWTDNSPGANILETQFSSPTVAEIGGQVQVIVPQSDGWVRAFDPETGKVVWEFDINVKAALYIPGGRGDRNSLLGSAVVYEDRVYIASGRDAEQGEGPGRLVCIDPTKRGDVSSELAVDAEGRPLPRRRRQAVDSKAGEKAVPNPNSALVWEFISSGNEFSDAMHRTMGSVALSKGLLICADFSGLVHCFDARTGKRHWSHDTLSAIWASPLIVDDKVYVADEDGDTTVFQLAAEARHAEPIATVLHPNSIYSSPVYANGVLYVPANHTLIAVDAADARRAAEHVAHWPQWRGPQRDNRSSDTGLLSSWPPEGPPLAWRVDGLGDGIASLALAEGRVFTSTTYGNSEYAVALDEGTGERLWATRIGQAVAESPLMRWLSQRTPTVDGNRVYVFSNSGWLVCLETATGSVAWRLSYPHEFGTPPGRWGYCDRPLIDGEKLLCVPGGSKGTVVALDKYTGTVVWDQRLAVPEAASYSAPLTIETSGLNQYVVFLDKGLASVAADDGRLLWRHELNKSQTGNCYTPLAVADGLLCPSRYQGIVTRLKLTRDEQQVTVSQQYTSQLNLDPFEDSTVLAAGHLFAFRQGGLPLCMEVEGGAIAWSVRPMGKGKAAATYADGHLYARWTDGTVALVEANPKAYVEKGAFKLPEPRPTVGATFPVVSGRRLYVRDNDRLYCYDVAQHSRERAPPAPHLVQLTLPRDADSKPGPAEERGPNAIFVPTPQDVVEKMLAAANVGKDDVVYDLGSGDGRIVIEAAKRYGCRAVGLEIDADLVKLSQERAQEAKVEKLVTIKHADFFSADFSDATVVAVYLYPALLKRLLPKLQQLKPGTRIVAHQFAIPDVPPQEKILVESRETGATHAVFLWTTPLKR